jgi:hypothetical protein
VAHSQTIGPVASRFGVFTSSPFGPAHQLLLRTAAAGLRDCGIDCGGCGTGGAGLPRANYSFGLVQPNLSERGRVILESGGLLQTPMQSVPSVDSVAQSHDWSMRSHQYKVVSAWRAICCTYHAAPVEWYWQHNLVPDTNCVAPVGSASCHRVERIVNQAGCRGWVHVLYLIHHIMPNG